MPKTASASLGPCTWAIPQSSRVIVTRLASAFHRGSSGVDAAVRRRRRSGRNAAVLVLCIRQCLLGLAPACKRLRPCAIQQLVGVADAEMMPAFVAVELFPRDRRRYRRPFARSRRIGHHRGRSALSAQPVEEDAALAL